jgi:L-amino acid N-acyltransferase YncA
VEIVEMQAEHAAEVLAIYRLGMDSGDATFETELPTWEKFFEGKIPGQRYVARDTDRILGWAVLSAIAPGRAAYRGVAEVSVYVHPEAQGRGVGRALLATAIESSEQAGFWTLLAGIFPENKPSMALHLAAGFRLIGVQERVGLHPFAGRLRWRDVARLERRSQSVGTTPDGRHHLA